MKALSSQNLKFVYKELDEVGTAMSLVGTRRQKLIQLARLVSPITQELKGERPEIKRVRDDLVRLSHNVRRAPLVARQSSKAVKALAKQILVVESLLKEGLAGVPSSFVVGQVTLINRWGYREKELQRFLKSLSQVLDFFETIGLSEEVGSGDIILDPTRSLRSSMIYDVFNDIFFANPQGRELLRGIVSAFGGRFWVRFFESRDVQTWGGASVAWASFLEALTKLIRGKSLDKDEIAKLTVSLGRIVGPEKWKKVL